MERKQYSAGMLKESFWFSEFRKVIILLNIGRTLDEIKTLNIEENIFSAPTQARAIQINKTVSRRVNGLDQPFCQLFLNSDLQTQKIIVLIAIMKTDSLFFDFMYEVFREKLIIGTNQIADSDIRVFFRDKQLQSERVAKWTDNAIRKLGTCYKTILTEAGLINRSSGLCNILKPILDKSVEDCMNENGMELILNSLTGVR